MTEEKPDGPIHSVPAVSGLESVGPVAPSDVTVDTTAPSIQAAQVRERFSIEDALTTGWQSTKSNFWTIVGIMTTAFLVQSCLSVPVWALNYVNLPTQVTVTLTVVLTIGSLYLGQMVSLGLVNIWLLAGENEPISSRDLWTKRSRTWNYIGGTILYYSMTILGYICLILPGIYLTLRFQFWKFFVADANAGPIESLKASYAITKGSSLQLFLFSIVSGFISWIGSILIIILVGPMVSQAMLDIGLAKIYRSLLQSTDKSELPESLRPREIIPLQG